MSEREGSAGRSGGPVKVFLADEHAVVREGTHAVLERQPDMLVVGETGLAGEVVEAVCELVPDVAVLALKFSGDDQAGVRICAEVNRLCPQVACIMFTAYQSDVLLNAAIRAGASGYILKGAHTKELVEAIRMAAAGKLLFDRRNVNRIRQPGNALDTLTPQERKVLELIGLGLSFGRIAARLNLSPQTVKNYSTRIYRKIGATNRDEAIDYARRAYEMIYGRTG